MVYRDHAAKGRKGTVNLFQFPEDRPQVQAAIFFSKKTQSGTRYFSCSKCRLHVSNVDFVVALAHATPSIWRGIQYRAVNFCLQGVGSAAVLLNSTFVVLSIPFATVPTIRKEVTSMCDHVCAVCHCAMQPASTCYPLRK